MNFPLPATPEEAPVTHPTDGHQTARDPEADARAISAIIDQLRDPNGLKRQAARHHLVEFGPAAVPALIELLSDKSEQTRWEAAKALSELPDPRAAEPLTDLLRDVDSLRWLAGTALINIGEPALTPLLRALIAHPDSPRLREGARRVLHELRRQMPDDSRIPRMLDALQGQAQTETVPWVARGILREMGQIPNDEA
jgi:HEAT repeat protein